MATTNSTPSNALKELADSHITRSTRTFKLETFQPGRRALEDTHGHSSLFCASRVGHKIYLCGTYLSHENCSGTSICSFDVCTNTWEWTSHFRRGSPLVSRNGCISYGSSLYFFGSPSSGLVREKYMLQACRFDLILSEWEMVDLLGEPILQRNQPTVDLLESANCAAIFGGIMHGGNGIKYSVYGDLVFVEMESLRRLSLAVEGRPPEPRFGHCSCSSFNKVFIFAGHASARGDYLNDLHVLTHCRNGAVAWSQPLEASKHRAIPLRGRSASSISFVYPSLLMTFGGHSTGGALCDPHIVDLFDENPRWKSMHGSSGEYKITGKLQEVMHHRAFTVNSMIYMLGAGQLYFPNFLRLSSVGRLTYYSDLIQGAVPRPIRRKFARAQHDIRGAATFALGKVLRQVGLALDASEDCEAGSDEDNSSDSEG